MLLISWGGSAGFTGNGGAVTINGGVPIEGSGGAITITGAAGVGTNQNGGSISITSGNATGSGTGGNVAITLATSPSGTPGDFTVDTFPVPRILSVTTSVNLKATGTTNLYTVPAGKSAVITDAIIKPTTATSAVGDAVVGIGVAAGEDDVFPPETLTGLTLTTRRYKFPSFGVSRVPATADVIKVGVDTADTGTALTASIYLIGYLI